MRRLAALFALVLALAACGDGTAQDTTTDTTVEDESTVEAATDDEAAATDATVLEIVATTSILGDLVASVVQGDATVEVLLPIGADPHDFAPSAAQATALRSADLVVANGLDLEEGLVSLLEGAEEDGVVVFEATDHVDLIEYGEEGGHSHGDDDHGDDEHGDDEHGDDEHGDDEHGDDEHGDDEHGDDEHGDDEHGDDEHGDDEHGDDEHGDDEHGDDEHGDDEHGDDEHGDDEHDDAHDHGDEDPHVWFDAARMAGVVDALGAELTALDDSIDWEARAADVSDDLMALDEEIREVLADIPDDGRILVTNHEALGYFADAYDFEIAATIIPGGSTLSEPSAADLQDVIDVVSDTGVTAIFAETTAGGGLADVVADEVGQDVVVVELFTESLSDADGPAPTYIEMMRFNATAIAEALS
jgi:zinc/manganese transport system substrate-binding protein